MEGNRSHRLIVVAALFAFGSVALLSLVWWSPDISWLWKRGAPAQEQQELTEEEREQVLREVEQSSAEAGDMSERERSAALESVSTSSDGPDQTGLTAQQR